MTFSLKLKKQNLCNVFIRYMKFVNILCFLSDRASTIASALGGVSKSAENIKFTLRH